MAVIILPYQANSLLNSAELLTMASRQRHAPARGEKLNEQNVRLKISLETWGYPPCRVLRRS